MKTIQLRANRHDGLETVPAQSKGEATFFSIYKGEPDRHPRGAVTW